MAINLQVGVKILLKNKDGKYLLVCRSEKKYPEVGPKWDIVGGRIDPGSSLIDNLRREVKEEIQLDFYGEAELISAQDILKLERHIVRLTYIGRIDGTPVLSDEHTDFKWLTLDEMKDLKGLDRYVAELLKKNVLHETYPRA